ncbi:MAG: phosphoribosyl-ATP diphosphatase [Weeksellaceae bacterium]
MEEQQNIPKKPKAYPFLKKLEKKMGVAKLATSKNSKLKRKFKSGTSQIAKKMGEEAVEMVIASSKDDDVEFLEEAADVFYYYLLAIHDRGYKLKDVLHILQSRDKEGKIR